MMPRSLVLALALAATACAPQAQRNPPGTPEPVSAPSTPATSASPAGDPQPAAPAKVVARGSGQPPWIATPPNVSCPPSLRAELERLLQTVSAHASVSAACYDGPGHHTTATLLAVQLAPAGSDGTRWVRIRYGAVSEPESGMQYCPKGCEPPQPDWGIAEISIAFAPVAGGWVMRMPREWPVVDSDVLPMTPLDQPHDGDCFGKSGPFSPAPVSGW